jgi:hypothetical protein
MKHERVFADAQPIYDAIGIATFPFDATGEDKYPLVRRYQRMGLPASRKMAERFPDAPGLAAMAGARNRLTVVDIDARGAEGERLLADVQGEYGESRFVVRTGSGGFHSYYRHNGEGRKIRPDARKPIDLIGGGAVVLPPTRGRLGNYEIIRGTVDDLAALERISTKASRDLGTVPAIDLGVVRNGERDKKFWGHVARQAHSAKSLDELIAIATDMNAMMAEPWTNETEIVKRCKYWWDKTQKGENWFGTGRYVKLDHRLVDDLMMSDPDAFQLLMFLRRHHWGRDFYLANEAANLMPGGGWTRKRFAAARSRLIELGYLSIVKHAAWKLQRPMLLRLVKNDHQ